MVAPASPNFRNLNELTTYLTRLENRLIALETENRNLKSSLSRLGQQASTPTFKTEEDRLPDTHLFSDSFLVRSFTVWGHYVVAQLIIGIPIFLCYMIIVLSAVGEMINQ